MNERISKKLYNKLKMLSDNQVDRLIDVMNIGLLNDYKLKGREK